MAKNLYSEILCSLKGHKETYALSTANVDERAVQTAIRDVMREHPEIFWFSHQWRFDEDTQTLHLAYNFSETSCEKIRNSIGDVVRHDFKLDEVRRLTTEQQVMYVYKWVAGYCNYNIYAAYNQTIASVFVHRNSVCTGYAKAAQYLLSLLGIESKLVFGRIAGSPENSRHCWNIVNIHGKWYHFDACMASMDVLHLLKFPTETLRMNDGSLCYDFFCVPTEAIGMSRTIEDIDSLPCCNGTLDAISLIPLTVSPYRTDARAGCLLADNGSTSRVFLSTTSKNSVLKVYKEKFAYLRQAESDFMQHLGGAKHLLHLCGTSGDGLAIEQGTALADLLNSHYYKLTISSMSLLLMDVLKGIKECYDRGIYYRDIHLNNVYRCSDGTYKLGDFGSCVHVGQTNIPICGAGSEWYMSPETFQNGDFDIRSAIYSVGMLAYFLLNDLFPPFWDTDKEDSLHTRMNGHAIPMPKALSQYREIACAKDLWSILSRATAFSPSDRFQSIDAMIHALDILAKEPDGNDIELWSNEFAVKQERDIDFASTCDSNPYIEVSDGGDLDGIIICDCDGSMDGCLEVTENGSVDGVSSMDGCFVDVEDVCEIPRPMPSYTPDSRNRIDDFATTDAPSFAPQADTSHMRQGREESFSVPERSTWSRLTGWFKKSHKVYSSLMAPSCVRRGSSFMVQVYVYKQGEHDKVVADAIRSDEKARERSYVPLNFKLKEGDKVDIVINIPYARVDRSKKSLIWQGEYTKAAFLVEIPNAYRRDQLYGEVFLTVNGATLGELDFMTEVTSETMPARGSAVIGSRQFHKIFISYSHEDAETVRHYAEAYRIQGIDYFFDRHKLQSGDVYSEYIRNYINEADLFVLMWSENARHSQYVPIECEIALKRAYPQVTKEEARLAIRPLSIQPRAPLPDSMNEIYNFEEV